MMDEFIKSSNEARTLLKQGPDLSPKTRATTYHHQPGQGETQNLSALQGDVAKQTCPNQKAVVEVGHLQGGDGRSPTDSGNSISSVWTVNA